MNVFCSDFLIPFETPALILTKRHVVQIKFTHLERPMSMFWVIALSYRRNPWKFTILPLISNFAVRFLFIYGRHKTLKRQTRIRDQFQASFEGYWIHNVSLSIYSNYSELSFFIWRLRTMDVHKPFLYRIFFSLCYPFNF